MRAETASSSNRQADWWNPNAGTLSVELSAAPYRRLALQLRHELAAAQQPHSILLAHPSRSTLPPRAAVLLAYCVAEELGQTVLLVDACGSSSELSRLLGCEHVSGYSNALSNPDTAPQPQRTSHPGVHFMPCGSLPSAAAGRSEDAVPRFMSSALATHDVVLVYGGSVLHDTVALSVAPHVSFVLLLPVENETLVADLDAAQKALRFCQARQIGVVMLTAGRSAG